MDRNQGYLSEATIIKVFNILDHIIATQELLMSVAPIRIMVTGGVVSVMHFHVRPSTEDVDFILDPNVDAAAEYRTEFLRAVRTAEHAAGIFSGRFNDHVRSFIPADTRQSLFFESVEQNVIIYNGDNVVAYASKYEWALQAKLDALQSRGQDSDTRSESKHKKITDTADAVELVRRVIEAKGGDNQPLSRDFVRALNYGARATDIEWAINEVADAFEKTYGTRGIV